MVGYTIRMRACKNPECQRPCHPSLLLCYDCWMAVSATLRQAVWDEYQPGQQDDPQVRLTREYARAARAAIRAAQEARPKSGPLQDTAA